jgi:cobyrinic acid a,c-diamide synthase
MAALARQGLNVGAAKVGPDFIDTGYHRLATGRPSRNLDAWICGDDAIGPLAATASGDADVLVVEGVMGLFDGSSEPSSTSEIAIASTAAVARSIAAPIVLVVDAAAMSQSVAALVHGYTTLHDDVRISAVVCNRVGSDSHEEGLRRALAPLGIPVLGCLRRDPALSWRDRHLGLVPVIEQPGEVRRSLDRLADAIERSLDLGALVRLARSAPPSSFSALPPAERQRPAPVRIAVAGGKAFSFVYPDNLERLSEAGAEILPFDPLVDEELPAGTEGLYAGGGFPEVYAEELAGNRALLGDVRRRAGNGMAIWAECGGLLWLSQSIGDHRLAGLVPARAAMTTRLSLGYRSATVLADSPVAPRGAQLRGHEYHYSSCEPGGEALELSGRQGRRREGYATSRLLATYLHLHLAAEAAVAERFVRTAGSVASGASS